MHSVIARKSLSERIRCWRHCLSDKKSGPLLESNGPLVLNHFADYSRRRRRESRLRPPAPTPTRIIVAGSGTGEEDSDASSTALSFLKKNPTPTGWPISGAPGDTVW